MGLYKDTDKEETTMNAIDGIGIIYGEMFDSNPYAMVMNNEFFDKNKIYRTVRKDSNVFLDPGGKIPF